MAQAVKVRWVADFQQLLREHKKVNEEKEKTNKKTKENQAETKKWERLATRALRSIETAQERYNRKLRETGEMLNRNKITQEQARRLVKRYADELERAGTVSRQTFGNTFTRRLAAIATGYIGLSRAAGLFSRELRDQLELQDRINRSKETAFTAEARLRANLPGANEAEIRKIIDESESIGRQVGMTPGQAMGARADILSATGGNRRLSAQLLRTSGAFMRGQGGAAIGEFGGAIGDLAAEIGGPQAGEAALGLFTRVQGLSRVVERRQAAQVIPSTLTGSIPFTEADRMSAMGTAGALFGAISTGARDVQGRRSATAQIQLVSQLQKFNEEQGLGLRTTRERIEFLQRPENRGVAEEFLAGASFEQRARGSIIQLLTDPGSVAFRNFQKFADMIPTDIGELSAAGQESLQTQMRNRQMGHEVMRSGMSAMAERVRAGQPLGFNQEMTTQFLDLMQQATGATRFSTRLEGQLRGVISGRAGVLEANEAIGYIQNEMQALREQRSGQGVTSGPGDLAVGSGIRRSDQDITAQLNLLQQMVELLRQAVETDAFVRAPAGERQE